MINPWRGTDDQADATRECEFPMGTPEYDAYAAELRNELRKFATGEPSYPYTRAKINHGALDTLYGIIVQARDGSWNPYMQMGTPGTEREQRSLAATMYGGEATTRVVRFVAKVLCDNPECPGHDDPEWVCVGFNDTPMYPKGTPEYDAYANELRGELDEFAAGVEPYPYS